MKAEGLGERSGVLVADLSSYGREEGWNLIQVAYCSPELQAKRRVIQSKLPNKKKSLFACLLIAIAFAGGMVFYYEQYPSPETRRELSVDGMFMD